jgi:hypothetical protein
MTTASDGTRVKLNRDGIPIDARDWTEADWQDLHNAIERAKNAIRKRHRASSDAKSTARNERGVLER